MSNIDEQILDTIDRIRAENHACTAGAVADRLRMSKSWIVQRCEIMRAAGIVDWTPMAGSLHRVRPVAVDRAETTSLPHGSSLVVTADPVPEPASLTTPPTPSAISDAHDITDEIGTIEWVTGNNDHSPSLSEPMNRSKRSKSSGT